MQILITGGAGYIGSFMTRCLLDKGHTITVIDNLSRGHKSYVDQRAQFHQADLQDLGFLKEFFSKHTFDGIIHFAGYISMGESMANPGIYFQNNVYSIINILENIKDKKNTGVIFSSTAGVYGNPLHIPIPEDHPRKPENPYGESKLMAENILDWYQKIYGISFASLRYFNACGAALDGSFGEDHNPETHIIPKAMYAVLQRMPFTLFGDDYETPDGTCIRDYIHVLDLVDAHILALEKLQDSPGGYFYNVGTGQGYSNREVLEMVKKVTGVDFTIQVTKRRPGDADRLIADVSKIKKELGFNTNYSDLKTIVESAYLWHRKHTS